jgi:gamma-D-glutamyl-L-lysine dipeptidyl-peptidase
MFGICAYNLVAVRAESSDKSEMVTQLLFGDSYKVLKESENGKWLLIEILEDDYQGWIDKKLHTAVLDTFMADFERLPKQICSEMVGYIGNTEVLMPIFFGSYLPLFDSESVYLNNNRLTFKGQSKTIDKQMSKPNFTDTAKSFLNTPYLWGGKSHAGIDCSGFVQMVFRSQGIKLKRDAWQQASMGESVENIEKAESCDLAFFSNDSGKVTHVGIMLSKTEIIHAHGKVRIDQINNQGIINGDTGLYSHTLSGIRRIDHVPKLHAP